MNSALPTPCDIYDRRVQTNIIGHQQNENLIQKAI